MAASTHQDVCPQCGLPALRVIGATRIDYRAQCQTCGHKVVLNDNLQYDRDYDADTPEWIWLVSGFVAFFVLPILASV